MSIYETGHHCLPPQIHHPGRFPCKFPDFCCAADLQNFPVLDGDGLNNGACLIEGGYLAVVIDHVRLRSL